MLMFSTHKIKYIWFLPKKVNFLFLSNILLEATCNVSPTEKGGAENEKTNFFSQPK